MESIASIKYPKVWQEQLRDLYLYKLGLCKRCIFTATVGVILSWTLFITLSIVFDNPLLLGLVGLVLIAALGFSIVWIGHIIAYYFRVLMPLSEARRSLEVVRADLSISTVDSRHVAGTFKQGQLGLSFEAAITNEDLFLAIRDLQGMNLLELEEKGRIIEIAILDGRMMISFPRLTLPDEVSRKEIARAIENHLSEVSISGEEESFRELQKSPNYELLPLLSKALGKAGITGDRLPAIVSLHLLAMGALSFRQQQQRDSDERPGLNNDQPDVVYRIKHLFQDELRAPSLLDFFYDEIDPCLPPFINDIYIFEAGYAEPWMTCGTGCKDENSHRYPNRSDNCFGMCGPGCTCWSLICGDCCYHKACAVHDTWCRSSGTKSQVLCWVGAIYGFTC